MKAYGRIRQHQHGYPDLHPNLDGKRVGMWWESEFENCRSKSAERNLAKKEINAVLAEKLCTTLPT